MHASGLAGHQAVVLWSELAVLLAVAQGLGAVARRLHQPAIVGALLAGLLLGPSVFGKLWPGGFDWIFPPDRRPLSSVAALCLLVLLVVLGTETDLRLIRQLGRPAALTTASSIVIPLGAGLAAGVLVPGELVATGGSRTAFAILLAGALSVSSLPVVARIITELGMVRRDFGQLAIAAATVNDAYGFLVIAVVAALTGGSGGGASALVLPLVGLVVFVVVLAVAGQPAVDLLLRRIRRHGPNVAGSLAICLVTAFAAAALTQGIGVDGALGAFLAGIVLGRSRFQQGQSLRYLEGLSSAVCAPIYFATAGLQVDLAAFSRAPVLLSFLALLVVAVGTKFGGVMLGSRLAGLANREGSALGIVLNGRGALQVIIGSAGLALGVFAPAAYTVIIVISILTSVAIPPVLGRVVREWAGSPQEQERLGREEELTTNVIVRGQRLLLPTRAGANSTATAAILHCAWPSASPLTLLSIGADASGEAPDTSGLVEMLSGREVQRRHVSSEHVVEEILAEANLGYGVIGLAAVESPHPGSVVQPAVAELLSRSPIPMVIVRRGRGGLGPDDVRFSSVLVPMTATGASRAGQEVALNISRNTGARVTLLHVLTRPGTPVAPPAPGLAVAGESAAALSANAVLVEAQTTATAQDVESGTLLRQGASAGEEVADAVRELGADLVVFGATVRRVGNRPFLGHTVEHLLEHVLDPTVVVVAMPEPATSDAIVGDPHTDRSAR